MIMAPMQTDDGEVDRRTSFKASIDAQIAELSTALLLKMKTDRQGLGLLSEVGLHQILKDEVENITLPTLVLREHARRLSGANVRFDSDAHIDAFLTRRMEILTRFLQKVSQSIAQFVSSRGFAANAVSISSLAGDSHNGAQRPIRFDCGDQCKYVL